MKEIMQFRNFGLDILDEMCLQAMKIIENGGNIDDQIVQLHHIYKELTLEMDLNQCRLISTILEYTQK